MDDDFYEDELNELFEAREAREAEAQAAGVARVRFRATHRNGRLIVLPHHGGLATHDSVLSMLGDPADDGLMIANLGESEISGEPGAWELTVTLVTLSEPPEEAEEALVEWATNVGYRRVWLPGRVVNCEPASSFLNRATCECGTCGKTWHQSGRAFWENVLELRSLPSYCLICGGDLQGWRVGRVTSVRPGEAHDEPDPDRSRMERSKR
jgi:hypothetical protein